MGIYQNQRVKYNTKLNKNYCISCIDNQMSASNFNTSANNQIPTDSGESRANQASLNSDQIQQIFKRQGIPDLQTHLEQADDLQILCGAIVAILSKNNSLEEISNLLQRSFIQQKLNQLIEISKKKISQQLQSIQKTIKQKNKTELDKISQKINNLNQQLKQLTDNKIISQQTLERLQRFKKYTEQYLKYSYNIYSLKLFIGVIFEQRIYKLYKYKYKAIELIDGIVSGVASNLHENIQDEDKTKRLTSLICLADQRIQQRLKQQDYQVPQNPQQQMKQASGDFWRSINFFIIAAWIISLMLAYRDQQSLCIDDPIPKIALTFRDWLFINGWLTLGTSLILITCNLTVGQDDYFERIKNFFNKKGACCKHFYERYQLLLKVFCLVAIAGKIFWIMFGIIIFLNNLDFSRCSDDLLNYTSLEFLAFFSFGIYLITLSIFKKIKQKKPRCFSGQSNLQSSPFDDTQQYQPLEEPSTSSTMAMLTYDGKDTNDELHIYVNENDLSDLMQKILIWTLVGWVYDLVLWKKDTSQCLTQNFFGSSMNFSHWLVADGFLVLGIFFLVIFLFIRMIVSSKEFTIWKQQSGLYHIQLKWFCDHISWSIGFLVILLIKSAWIVYGIVLLFTSLDLDICLSNVSNFIIVYFTESVYIAVEGLSIIIKGYKMDQITNQKLKNKRELRLAQLKKLSNLQNRNRQSSSQTQPINNRQIFSCCGF